MAAKPRVLMLGFDSAEHSLVRSLVTQGRMPVLAGLMRAGSFGLLDSPAEQYPGAVWPSFYTGRAVPWHGIYHGKQWNAAQMCCVVPDHLGELARPFWESFTGTGLRSCIVDIPLLLGAPRPIDGVFLSGWGTHDPMVMTSRPERLWRDLAREFGRTTMPRENYGPQTAASMHPLCGDLLRATEQLERVTAALLRREAWDFSCVVFGTAHRAGHYLWDLGELRNPERLTDSQRIAIDGAVADVYTAIDRAFGELMAAAGKDVTVMVFAVHGMGRNPGWSDFVPAILDARSVALGQRAARKGLVYELRQRYATNVLRPIVRAIPPALTARLLPWWTSRMFDWSRMPFFPIPMDVAGYVRMNLEGRERDGIVPAGARYDDTLKELEAFFAGLRDGATHDPIVDRVVRGFTVAPAEAPQRAGLPDLIIEWGERSTREVRALVSDAVPAFEYDVPERLPSGRSGNHKRFGWFVAAGPGIPAGAQLPMQDILDLAPTVLQLLGRELSPELQGRPLPFETAA